MNTKKDKSIPVVFALSSGKGGVGKTNMSVNLAYGLARQGYRTLLMDADLGLGNVDVLLGLAPEKNLFHLFYQQASVQEILMQTEYGFSILPAASGVSDMLSLTSGQKLELLEAMDPMEEEVDFFLVDTGAGINDNVLYFNLAVQHRVIIVTPEPTSLTDAYALIKVLYVKHGVRDFQVLVNMARDDKEAKRIFSKLYAACDHFLKEVSLHWLGHIPLDPLVPQAVVKQMPFCALEAQGPASKQVLQVAQNIINWDTHEQLDGNIKFFWKQLLFQG
ncbi:MAG: MinD/ParA family protein [Desulfohalobiaceae bacterium]